MKNKILILLTAFALVALSAVYVVSDGLGIRTTNKVTTSVTDTDDAGADTLTLTPGHYETIVVQALTDSVTYAISSTVKSKQNDRLCIQVTNTSGSGKVKFPTAYFETASADSVSTITSSKRAIYWFTFVGNEWVMTSKYVQ